MQPIKGIKNGNYYLVTEVGGSSDVDCDHVLHNAQVQLQEREHSWRIFSSVFNKYVQQVIQVFLTIDKFNV